MRRVGSALAGVFALVASNCAARGDEASDLLFFSSDLISGRSFAGLGWLHAPSGLDASGPISSIALGARQSESTFEQAAAGWRVAGAGFALTLAGGIERGTTNAPLFRPLGSADLWWEPTRGWMVSGLAQTTPEYFSWRAAIGWRPSDPWPWIGPELASITGALRSGLHATGLRLGSGFEARLAVGLGWRGPGHGPYGEVAIWRRF